VPSIQMISTAAISPAAANTFSAKQTFLNEVEMDGALNHDGTTVGFFGTTPASQAAAIASPTAPGVVYVQADAASLKTAIDAIRSALKNVGITL
jgi:hypothetical protein